MRLPVVLWKVINVTRKDTSFGCIKDKNMRLSRTKCKQNVFLRMLIHFVCVFKKKKNWICERYPKRQSYALLPACDPKKRTFTSAQKNQQVPEDSKVIIGCKFVNCLFNCINCIRTAGKTGLQRYRLILVHLTHSNTQLSNLLNCFPY